ncbi:hypothetical protein ACFLY2_00280 [Patescibacteria group bacterium]
MEEKLYLAMLHKMGIGHKKLHLIFSDNSNYKDFYTNLSSDILKKYNFLDKQIEFLLENKNKFKFEDLERKLDSRKAQIVTINDELFPDFLKEIPNIPYLFYLR